MEGLAEVHRCGRGACQLPCCARVRAGAVDQRAPGPGDAVWSGQRLPARRHRACGRAEAGERSPEDMKALTAQVAGEDARVYLDADQAQTLFQSAPQVRAGTWSAVSRRWPSKAGHRPGGDPDGRMDGRRAAAAEPRRDPSQRSHHCRRAVAGGTGIARHRSDGPRAGVPLDAPAPDSAAASARVQVQQSVMAQLVGTSDTAAQAESQAQLWGAMFGRLGEVTGQDPVRCTKRYAAGIDAAEAPAERRESQPHPAQRGIDAWRSSWPAAHHRYAAARPSSVRAAPMCSAQASGCWPTIGAKPATS